MKDSKPIIDLDQLALQAMQSYLRTSENGGMPKEESDKIKSIVKHAASLKYFTMSIGEYMVENNLKFSKKEKK